ncbi:MAG TPA: hypothetical protein VGT41_03125 [Candidatus Babeliales bacterium]|nr:hypothetical protein [Candidatus Babeliales bacterium]
MNIHYLITIFLFFTQLTTATIHYALHDIDTHTIGITITVPIQGNDFLYKDYISFSVDHPDIQLSSWKSNIESTTHYNTRFKDSKKIFNKDVTITLTAQKKTDTIKQARLYFNYYLHSKNHISEIIFPLITKKNEHSVNTQEHTIAIKQSNLTELHPTTPSRKKIDHLKNWYATHIELYIHSRFVQAITLFLLICILGLFLYFHNRMLFLIEIKKIALWCALAILIYFSHFISASHYTIYIAAVFCAITGLLYSIDSEKTTSRPWRHVKTIIGILLLVSTFPLLFEGYKNSLYK